LRRARRQRCARSACARCRSGLDLRGGLYLLYQVDVNAAVSQALEGYAQDARRALAAANIRVKDVITVALGKRPTQCPVRVLLPPKPTSMRAQRPHQPLAGFVPSAPRSCSGRPLPGVMTPAQIVSARTTRSSRTSPHCATV